ncbi:MAG: hypothetical protein AAB555_02405 [Patescibacteria group bacterium]
MIYLFHGSDVEKTRAKAFEWVATARKKEPNLAYVRLAREELTNAALEDAALSGGLFVKRLLILLDDPFVAHTRYAQEQDAEIDENEVAPSELIEDHLDELVASDNAIVILAPKLAATKAKKISARAKMEYKFDKKAALEDKRGFNSALVNALGARNRDKLWLEINRALRAGDAPEMLHGLLHWKARDMRDRKLSLDLINLLQSSRRSGLDLSLSLERFALSL